MRTIMAAFLLSLALVAPAALVAAPAEAAPARGCVTKAEYKKVKRGMSPSKVKRIFGTGGKILVRDAEHGAAVGLLLRYFGNGWALGNCRTEHETTRHAADRDADHSCLLPD